MEDLFRSYWWLIFPIFGMVMGLWGMVSSERKQRAAMDVLKHYAEQGRDPPAELLKLAMMNEDGELPSPDRKTNSNAWNFVIFAALAAGFGTGYWMVRGENYAFAFLIVTVVMSVLAVGALAILIFGSRKS